MDPELTPFYDDSDYFEEFTIIQVAKDTIKQVTRDTIIQVAKDTIIQVAKKL